VQKKRKLADENSNADGYSRNNWEIQSSYWNIICHIRRKEVQVIKETMGISYISIANTIDTPNCMIGRPYYNQILENQKNQSYIVLVQENMNIICFLPRTTCNLVSWDLKFSNDNHLNNTGKREVKREYNKVSTWWFGGSNGLQAWISSPVKSQNLKQECG
jgi:hypothetical protein